MYSINEVSKLERQLFDDSSMIMCTQYLLYGKLNPDMQCAFAYQKELLYSNTIKKMI